MIILGIDPGIARVGWGLLFIAEPSIRAKAYGCIETSATSQIAQRLIEIHKNLKRIILRYKPDCISMEDLFFATNAKTAILVGEARGAILLTAALAGIPVISYTPLAVKRTISGDGHADKIQMQHMITRILRLKEIPKPDDAADALAIALTHAYSYKMKNQLV